MPVPSHISVRSTRRLSLFAVTSLALLWGGERTLAQPPEGVIFVEDIEQQVRRQQQAAGPWDPASGRRGMAPAPRPMGPATAPRGGVSPGQRPSQFPAPQSTAQGQASPYAQAQRVAQAQAAQARANMARGAQQASNPRSQAEAAQDDEKKSWRDKFTFKNPFGKLFAPRQKPQEATGAPAVEPSQVAQRGPQRPASGAGLQQRPHGARPQGLASLSQQSAPMPQSEPRRATPSREMNPLSDPFNGERPMATAMAGMPLASARSGLAGPTTSGPAASEGQRPTGRSMAPPRGESTRPTTADLEGVVLVSDLDDKMLGNLPSIEGPVARQADMPEVVRTPPSREIPAQAVAENRTLFTRPEPARQSAPASHGAQMAPESEVINPMAVASTDVRPAVGEEPADQPQHVVNNHVQLAAATSSTTGPSRSEPTTPQSNSSTDGFMARQGDATRARRAVPAHVPQVVENPVTNQGAESRASREKAVEYLTRASELSQNASTEDQYTQVLQLCRSALAIDNSANVQRYSNELAAWALNRRGEAKADRGDSKEALLDFEDALRLDPQRWRAIHNRGVIAAQEGRFAEAFDDFNRTLELNPKFAKAYSNRAALFVQAGDLESALDDYQQAITFDPELAIAHKGRAKVCHMLGDFEGALRHFDAAMLLAPEDATIVNFRGDLLCDTGRYADAARSYRQAIELDGNLVDAYRNLSWLAATCPDQQLRNPEAALALANRMMELMPQPGDLEYDTLAAAHAISGDFAKAIELMDKAIELSPPGDVDNYKWRRQLYEQNRPYITEPAGQPEGASDAS